MMNNAGGQSTSLKYNTMFTTQNIIAEASWMYDGSADDLGIGEYASFPGGGGGGNNPHAAGGYYASYEFYSGSKPTLMVGSVPTATASSQDLQTSGTNYVLGQVVTTPTSETMNFLTNNAVIYETPAYSGFTTAVSYSGSISNSNTLFYVGSSTGGATAYMYLYWIRVRADPPGGVMPSASFGPAT